MEPILRVQNLTKTFTRSGQSNLTAVNGISFDLLPGECLGIIGESGSGKTTLMNLIGCLDVPTSGSYLLGGQDITKCTPKQLAEVRNKELGFVFQFYNLVGNLTALENVELAAQICKDPLDAATVLDEVGLAKRANNFPGQLSGGEQQRVAIARALVNNPSTIVADEPTGNLDPNRSLEIMTLLERINALGTTVIVVTHERGLVNRFNKRIILLNDGQVIGDGLGSYEV